MGLDSVELVMTWEESFGIQITNAESGRIANTRQAIDLIATKLPTTNVVHACLTMRGFNRLRGWLVASAGMQRKDIRPGSDISKLLSDRPGQVWDAVRQKSGVKIPKPGWLRPKKASELTEWLVVNAAKNLKDAGEPWTPAEIRSVIRASVFDITRNRDFSDDDHFVRDIGIN